MPSSRNLVMLFTRYPQPGKCKTRLIPPLGAHAATDIHRQLVSHVLQEIELFISKNSTEFSIYYDGGSNEDMQKWLGSGYSFIPQKGNDLGERMTDALTGALDLGKNVILLGSDCPAVTHSLLHEALEALEEHDTVLGPAHDGGYYLIGVAHNVDRERCRRLFSQIPWSTPQVLSKTLERIDKLTLSLHTLPTLHDIDTAEDLKHFHHYSHPQ